MSRETATPATTGGLWGDVVQFSAYDAYGRLQKNQLPYTTTTESGKFKTAPQTEQPQYYTNVYNETSAFSDVTFDNSPLNRVTNVKSPGTVWAAAAGNSASYDMNSADENVQIFSVDYVQGNAPLNLGAYPANSLYKVTYSDENGKQVIEYVNKTGQSILKKIQIDDVPSTAHAGWICTYSIYDDLGLLRFQLQPEAVKYLDEHSWSFSGTDGQQVLNELCFQYNYDDKGRTIWKKAPGAAPLVMLYDNRDRVVFTQDGNQAAIAGGNKQWTVHLYDILDRPVITTLYNTTATAATLQNNINSAPAETTVQIRSGGQNGIIGRTFIISTSYNPLYNRSVYDWMAANILTVLQYNFYDNYSLPFAAGYITTVDSLPYSISDPNVQPSTQSTRTLSMPTGILKRVLGLTTFRINSNSSFLNTAIYYNDKGQMIGTFNVNIRSGFDVTSFQYHFDGRMLGSYTQHGFSGVSTLRTRTRNNFDKLGRITSVQKGFGGNAYRTVLSYEYDDMGRMKTKTLDSDYTAGGNTGLESLNYSYNIQNQLTGINKDYALKNPGNYDKWGHFFGMYLGYDNRDNVFTKSRLNGQVTGIAWSTQGDDAQRKYDYEYDNAGRLAKAAFTEQKHPGDGWSNNKMDFSVSGTNGKINYDLNGNLLNMLQKGVLPGNASPITVDDLNYSYASLSNKLQSVTDQMTNTTVNGQFGDFKDGTNTTPDYVYDANGNMVIDLNKNAKDLENVVGANGISYNVLDKPEKIHIAGKGTIRIVYSGMGEKLQRAYIPDNGDTAIITTYIGQYIYRQKAMLTTTAQPPFGTNAESLAFINFEAGRIRIIQPTSSNNGYDALAINGNIALPGGKTGTFDYFIQDYQENVRMILTEESHAAYNTCTMESARSSVEEPVFGQTGAVNEVLTTRYAAPPGWQNTDIGSSVSRLGNIAGHNIGPNTLQKVMAGDTISASVWYYYDNATGGSNPNFVSTLLTSLGQAITGSGGASGLVKGNVTGITNGLNGTTGFINAVQPTGSGGTTPQAYLTILFFDERFNFIEATDGGVLQQQVASSVGSNGLPLALGSIKAPKNGYAYVYVSNQSDQNVYFDNFKVGIARGRIIEENHYYAYGLKIAAISSTKAGDVNEGMLKNNYQYQGEFSELDNDINWNNFALRNYDPQVGRWVQQDPFDEFPSPYTGMGNDPVNNIDPSGGSIFNGLSTGGRLAVTTIAGAFIGGVADAFTGGDGWKGAGIGAGLGLGAGLGSLSLHIAASLGINTVNTTVAIFKSGTTTTQVGIVFRSSAQLSADGGAWTVKNKWSVEYIQQYRSELNTTFKELNTSDQKFTCDDLALQCIISFASKNNLPFKWVTGSGTFDAADTKYNSVSKFMLDVKQHSGAPDFANDANTTPVDVQNIQTGTLNVLTSTGRKIPNHIQIISTVFKNVPSMYNGFRGGVTGFIVAQGNFRGPTWLWNRYTGSDDPISFRYLGVNIQVGVYDLRSNIWESVQTGQTSNFLGGHYANQYREFNFMSWN